MKLLTSTLCSLMLMAAAQAAPIVVDSPVDHLFIPKGFDNNDNVEVVVSGKFPNSCYSRNKVEVKVKGEKIQVSITALVNTDAGKECEELDIPYLESVTLGSLQASHYQIEINNTLKGSLEVVEASSNSIDDHLYALVDYVELGFTGGASGEVFLIGRTADCVVFDRTVILSNGKDTLSILPIMKKVDESCATKRVHFSIPVKFNPNEFNQEKMLLFVKTMDGKSVNALIEK